ncbi:WYL domain-containing protein [Allokutzneria sp. A3M-2-11 16]|uniref:helix-turn-helix transcriptional regulator n=1 Tax=Allokutzneria sp. A3M-2-11 16 TaxID=2962043 RepID=UPI0020B739C2|nr:WYL domain-containing protein [Allokutzneria sp. A3M-2-11 16]MCP3805120.1 WYL domain-containing protein [Allokutzneria sp. A3M-2-11 16]
MLETSARLLRLLSLLQAPREWTGTELADRLEVSTRTVRNDVERLRALGYPVNATRGSAGGYRLGAGAQLPPLLLDDEEAVAVTIGLRTAAGGTIAGVEETALRALAKVEQVLPTRLRRRVSALQDYTVAVPRDEPGPRVDSEILVTLTAACRDGERLRFRYQGHGGEPSARLVEPYQLVNWGRRWYLVAWDAKREDWRTFRVDRLTEPFATGARFARRELPEDVVDRVRRGVSGAAWQHTAKVTVHAAAEVVAAKINPAVGTVRAVDADTCELHTGSDSLHSLAVHLGLLDLNFTVTEPPELVELVRRLSDRYRRAVHP